MRRYNFWLVTDVTERLRALAEQRGVSMSELVRLAIEKYLEQKD